MPARSAARGASVGWGFPIALVGAALLLLFTCGFGPNLDLALLALAILVTGGLLLWRPGETPVLLATFTIHWIGAVVALFHANWLDLDIFLYSPQGGDMRRATVLSLVGVLCLAAGMRAGAGTWRPQEAAAARRIALAHPPERWFQLYAAACIASLLSVVAIQLVPGLAQIFLAVVGLRWAFFFTLVYACLVQGRATSPYVVLTFLGELAVSLGGYFSEFRTVFFLMLYAAFASGLRLTARMQLALGALVAVLLAFGIVWTGVKEEYRTFVSEGRKEQVVTVDYATRMGKLAELAGALDARAVENGVDHLLRRLSYVTFLSVVLGYVPSQMAHEDGALLVDAVTRPLLPRALFPGKTAIDDTQRTNIYTGGVAGTSEGTSISIGYIAETYIDFGSSGMMVALLGIGLSYGLVHRWLTRARAAGPLVGMGLASAVLLSVGLLESSITKVAGALVASILVAGLFLRFVAPAALRWAAGPGR